MQRQEKIRKMTLWSLAIPLLLESILKSMMGTVNTLVLSHVSDAAVASVGVANQVLNVVIIASSMMASGSAILLNQKLGAGESRDIQEICGTGIAVSIGIGLFFSIVCVFLASPILKLIGLSSDLSAAAEVYLRIVGASCIIQFLSTMIATQFRCYGDAKTPMLVIVFNNLINLAGCCLVVFVLPGIFPNGVMGVALVRLFSESLGLAIIIFLHVRAKIMKWSFLNLKPKLDMAAKVLKLGFMSGLEGISFTMAQLITTGFLSGAGEIVLSAKVYTQTITNYSYMLGLSIGQASQIISGHLIGSGEEEQAFRMIKKCWLYIAICNLVLSGLVWIFSDHVVHLFSKSAEVLALSKKLLFIDILICMGRSLNHSFNYGLRSAGFVFYPMIIANCSIWLINVCLGWCLCNPVHLGIIGIWIAQLADEWLRGSFAVFFWMKGLWKKTLRKNAIT